MSSWEPLNKGHDIDDDPSKPTVEELGNSFVERSLGTCLCGNVHRGPLQAFSGPIPNASLPIVKSSEIKLPPDKSTVQDAQKNQSKAKEASTLQTTWSKDSEHFEWMNRKREVLCVLGSFNILLLAIALDSIASGKLNFMQLIPWLVTIVSCSVFYRTLLVDYADSRAACYYVSPVLFVMAFLSWFVPTAFCRFDGWCKLGGHDSETLGLLLSLSLLCLVTAAPLMTRQASCFLSLIIPVLYSSITVLQPAAATSLSIFAPVMVIIIGITITVLGYFRSHTDMELLVLTDRWRQAFLESKLSEEQARKVIEEKDKDIVDKISKMRQFISYIFHEIRVVLGIGHLLAGNVSDEQREILKMMDSSSSSMIRILNDVLDMGKIEAGKLQLEKQPFNMGELISSLVWAYKDTLESKGIDFTLCVDPSTKKLLSNYNLIGDKHRVRQVLANYLSNAAKFTPRGGKVCLHVVCNGTFTTDLDVSRIGQSTMLSTRYLSCEALVESVGSYLDGESEENTFVTKKHTVAEVTISVEDTGIGISKEDQARLFEPYMQTSAGASQGGGGTGLGLSFSKKIVELAGGNIGVFSEVGKGSVFLFTLPFQLMEHSKDRVEDGFQSPFHSMPGLVGSLSGTSSSGRLSRSCAAGHKPKVLIVEDNQVNRRILRKLLTSLNVDSEDAEDGKQAVELCRNGAMYDMILIDKEMPIMDGHEATRELRAMGVKAPIVGLTGNALDSDRNQFLAAGVDDFFTKPISRHQLVKLLETYSLIARVREKENLLTLPLPSVAGSPRRGLLREDSQR